MSSSSTSKQPTIYKRRTNLWRKTRTQNSCSQIAPKTACSFFQTCSFLFFLSFFSCFSFVRGKGNGEGKGVVIFLRGSSLAVHSDLRRQSWESGCDVPRKRATTVAFQASLPWRPEAGAGASSPLTWLRRRPGVWSSAALRNPAPSSGGLG